MQDIGNVHKILVTYHFDCSLSMKLLWLSDAMWWHRFGSTLAQVMACCLAAPSQYRNQCWPSINEVPRHLNQRNFTVSAQATVLYHGLEIVLLKLTVACSGIAPCLAIRAVMWGEEWWLRSTSEICLKKWTFGFNLWCFMHIYWN